MKQHLVKHSYAAIVALFIAMFALPQLAQAQTMYDLEIAGTRVTSNNCDDLTRIDGVSGTVKYDPQSNILTLKDATITSKSGIAIISEIDGLTIEVIGTNNVETNGNTALRITKPLTITGGGTLNLNSKSFCGLNVYKTGLTINDCVVNVKGDYGIVGYAGEDETLLIRNATVTAEGRIGSIFNFASLTLEGCSLAQPAGAVFDPSRKAVVLNGSIVKSKVVIGSLSNMEYDLWIAGKQVTSDNCKDLAEFEGVSGSVIYDPQSNILTLENATIDTTSPNAIDSRIDNLTINLIGTNRLVTANTSTLRITKPLTITGGGTLNVNSLSSCGILVIHTDLTITDCIVTAVGHEGITGAYGSDGKLLIKNATVTAEGKDGSICDFGSLTLEGCAITQPAGAAFDPSEKAVALNGEKVTSEVVITPQSTDYDLQICGTQVTSDNCGDLTIFDGVSGTVKYDPTNKVLTLQSATISSTTTNAIVSNIDGLTMNVIGTNSLTTTDKATISFRRPLTITGGGTLNAKSGSDCAVYANETNLTINNCTVNAESSAYAIAGSDGTRETLTINNAMVTAEGKENGSICDFANVVLVGCDILQPTGAAFDADLRSIALNGAIVKSKVIIGDPSSIHTPTIDNAAKQGIYTLSGAKLNSKVEDLPKGIYIVNGKKVVK